MAPFVIIIVKTVPDCLEKLLYSPLTSFYNEFPVHPWKKEYDSPLIYSMIYDDLFTFVISLYFILLRKGPPLTYK